MEVNTSSSLYETLVYADSLCEGAPVTATLFRDAIIGAQCAIKAQASVGLGHYAHRSMQRHSDAPDGVIIWRLYKHLFFLFVFSADENWRSCLRAHAQIVDNARKNLSRVYWHHVSGYSSDILAPH